MLENDERRARLPRTHFVQLEVEAASIADWIAAIVSAPKCCCLSMTVAATHALPSSGRHALLGPRLGSVGAVGLDVEAAGVADVVAVHVAPPERSYGGAAVDALAA